MPDVTGLDGHDGIFRGIHLIYYFPGDREYILLLIGCSATKFPPKILGKCNREQFIGYRFRNNRNGRCGRIEIKIGTIQPPLYTIPKKSPFLGWLAVLFPSKWLGSPKT